MGDEYDSVMNYPLLSGIHDFFLDKSMDKAEFEYMVNRCYTMYMQQNNNVMFNLLDSHDTERLMNRFHDLDMFYQQLAVLFTMPGSACIYYGTEIAMEGGHDPDCRRPMPWHELSSPENQEKIAAMRSLIEMRKSEEACRSLYFHFPGEYPQGAGGVHQTGLRKPEAGDSLKLRRGRRFSEGRGRGAFLQKI